MSLMDKLGRRWEARQRGTEPIRVDTDVVIAATRERVWSFVMHPDSARLLDPEVVNTFRVPGSLEMAVGEQHCTVLRHGSMLAAHITEVVGIDAPRSVSFQSLTAPGGFVASYLFEELGSRTRLTYRVEGQVAAGTKAQADGSARTSAAHALNQMRAVVESGASLSSDA
jgi:hypothetical protein